jgi:hypothetical protein
MLWDLEFERISKEDVSDAELKNFMERRAGNILKKEDATLTSIFHELKLDQTIPDACDQIAGLWSQWYAIRNKCQVAYEFATERGRKRFRKEIAAKHWPSDVKERVLAKLEGLDKEANDIREDDRNFFDFVVLVAEESQIVFKASNKEKHSRKLEFVSKTYPHGGSFKKQKMENRKMFKRHESSA